VEGVVNPGLSLSIAEVRETLAAAARRGPRELDAALGERTWPYAVGGRALFVYRGPAEEVRLHHWIHALASAQPFERIEGTDLWVLDTQLQRRARVEYKLEIVHHGRRQLVADSLNPNSAHDPFGSNSVAVGPEYQKPEWAEPHSGVRKGRIIERQLKSDVFGDVRPIGIYLPPRYRETRRYPLVIAHDGFDYVRFSALEHVLDNLIERLELPQMIVALTQSPNRLEEYAANDQHAKFLVEELLPLLEGEFPLLEGAEHRGLLGASFGAVASLHAAWARPGHFGRLFLQSGSFAFADIGDHGRGPIFDPVVRWVQQFREDPGHPAERIQMSCGVYESLIAYNRAMLPVLQGTGADVRLSEDQDGHNWENWRDRLRAGLTWLFPGPFWMVYE
jgi:enterochelin esterase-like enzyme